MAFQIAGFRNGFFPELSGIVTAFMRKPDKFAINRYAQYLEAKKNVVVYSKIHRDTGIRIDNQNRQLWRDGADHPSVQHNKIDFDNESAELKRYSEGWELGFQAEDQFDLFNIKAVHLRQCVSLIMTALTLRAVTTLTTSGNYDATHVAAANTWNGGRGFFHQASADEGDAKFNAISEALLAVLDTLHKDSNGVLGPGDYKFVCNPTSARKMANSGEMKAYLKGSPDARKMLEDPGNMNARWGLPPTLFGLCDLVVEDAVYTTDRRKTSGAEATSARTYIFPDNKAVVCSQVGGIDGDFGGQNYSTMGIFWYGKPVRGAGEVQGQMVVSGESNTWDQKIKGRCTIQTAEEILAPASGAIITNLFS